MKYISLPSKETEHDPRSTSVTDAEELTDPQYTDNDEQETMLNSKERGEDESIIDMENIDYGKPDVS